MLNEVLRLDNIVLCIVHLDLSIALYLYVFDIIENSLEVVHQNTLVIPLVFLLFMSILLSYFGSACFAMFYDNFCSLFGFKVLLSSLFATSSSS